MNDTNTLDPQQMIELLRRQQDCYAALQQLSQTQRSLITGERPDLLLTVLGERQSLVSELLGLNNKLAPYRRAWDDLVEHVPESQREEVAELLRSIGGLLRSILETDQQDSAVLSARKQIVGRSLSELSGGRSAHLAYAPGGETREPGAADLTG